MARAVRLPDLEQDLPVVTTKKQWIAWGIKLGKVEKKLEWAIAAWWNAGERYGDRSKIVQDPRWEGPSLATCRNYAQTARKFDVDRRQSTLSMSHHAAVQNLPAEKADRLLTRAAKQVEETSKPPSVQTMRQWAKQERREERDTKQIEQVTKLSEHTGKQLYSVILADPPWRFETYSEMGRDRSAENHYPTMRVEEICALGRDIPTAPNCVLFLWRTREMVKQGVQVAEAWGFTVKSEFIWVKPTIGLGYYNRGKHEVLMVCTKGDIGAPLEQDRLPSVFEAPKGEHSAKPDCVYEMIELMYPDPRRKGGPEPEYYFEMFARRGRHNWAAWGNQAPKRAAA